MKQNNLMMKYLVTVTIALVSLGMTNCDLIKLPGKCPENIVPFRDFTLDEISGSWHLIALSSIGPQKTLEQMRILSISNESVFVEKTKLINNEEVVSKYNVTVFPNNLGYFQEHRADLPGADTSSIFDCYALALETINGNKMGLSYRCKNVEGDAREEELAVWSREKVPYSMEIFNFVEHVIQEKNPILASSYPHLHICHSAKVRDEM